MAIMNPPTSPGGPYRKSVRPLLVEPGPVDLVCQSDKLMLHVDDLVKARQEQIVVARLLLMFRSRPIPRIPILQRITNRRKIKCQIARKPPPEPRCPANSITSNLRSRKENQRHPRFSQRTRCYSQAQAHLKGCPRSIVVGPLRFCDR